MADTMFDSIVEFEKTGDKNVFVGKLLYQASMSSKVFRVVDVEGTCYDDIVLTVQSTDGSLMLTHPSTWNDFKALVFAYETRLATLKVDLEKLNDAFAKLDGGINVPE